VKNDFFIFHAPSFFTASFVVGEGKQAALEPTFAFVKII